MRGAAGGGVGEGDYAMTGLYGVESEFTNNWHNTSLPHIKSTMTATFSKSIPHTNKYIHAIIKMIFSKTQ